MFQKRKNRQVAGLRAKRAGESWEGRMNKFCYRENITVVPIMMGCRQVGKGKLIRVRNPFDFCLVYKGRAVFLDAKTTLGKTFCYSELTDHQVHWLSATSAAGCSSGYLVEFRAMNMVVFFPVELLAGLRPGQSLKPSDGLLISSDMEDFSLKRLFNDAAKEAQTPGEPLGTLPISDL